MTLKILYKLTNAKKRVNCQTILDNEQSKELFKYFNLYIEY